MTEPPTSTTSIKQEHSLNCEALVSAAQSGNIEQLIDAFDRISKGGGAISDTISQTLFTAARAGHRHVLETLVNRGCRVVHGLTGTSPLLHAGAAGGHPDVVGYVLENGADVNGFDSNGWTALHIAAENGHTSVIQRLCDQEPKAAINACTKTGGDTPLLLAVKAGNLGAVRLLLDSNAGTTVSDDRGGTPLYIAARDGNLEIVTELLNRKVPVDAAGERGEVPLVAAARHGHAHIVRQLLDYEARPHPQSLHFAAQFGYSDVIQELLCCGALTELKDAKGLTPLFIASQNGHTKSVQALLEGGAQVNAVNNAGIGPVYMAAKKGHATVVATLVDAGADVHVRTKALGLTSLHVAAQEGHSETGRVLLAAGAQCSAASTTGQTPIMLAATNGRVGMVELLLEVGVDVDTCFRRGETLLHLAAKAGRRNVVDLLVKRGAELERRKLSNAETPLYVAAQEGWSGVVETLLDYGAQVETPNKSGKTAIVAAAERCHDEVVRLLLLYGAKKEAALRALAGANSTSHKAISELLKNFDHSSVIPPRKQKASQDTPKASQANDVEVEDEINLPLPPDVVVDGQAHINGATASGGESTDGCCEQNGTERFGVNMPLKPPPAPANSNAFNGYDLPSRGVSNQQESSGWVNGVWKVAALQPLNGQDRDQGQANGKAESLCVQESRRSVNDLKDLWEKSEG